MPGFNESVKERDGLVDLASQYYYSARDTTYNTFSDNTVRRWLESRGLVKPHEQKKAEE